MRKQKSLLIVLSILLIIGSVVGVSYAYWYFGVRQRDFNHLGTKCFEVSMVTETDAITMGDAYPVTDEEGLKQTGYTFTIQNTCNTIAYYQVNLEEVKTKVKRLSSKYVKASLNDGKGKVLENYESVEPTIKDEPETYDTSHKLTSGSLQPDETATYTLKLWMDYDTPPIEEVMNATFQSKVTITASYIEEEQIQNSILVDHIIEPEEYSKDKEAIEFVVTNTNENIKVIEYSLDGEHYNPIQSKEKIEIEFTEEKEYTIYFRDEMGNVSTEGYTFTPSKLDQTGPEITTNEVTDENGDSVLTITFTDLKSGIQEYKIDEGEWTSLTNESVTLQYEENKAITIYGKDKLGNISEVEYTLNKVDNKGPEIIIENEKEGIWANGPVTVRIQATDEAVGIDKFYYSSDNNIWNEIKEVDVSEKAGTATFTISDEVDETYTVKVVDKRGNESTKSTSIKIDLTKPEQSITLDEASTGGDNNWYKSASIKVTGSDTGGSGISGGKYCESNTDCEPTKEFTSESTTVPLSEGQNREVCVIFKDNAGNESDKSCSDSYNVDGSGPIIQPLTSNEEWGSTNTITGTVKDELSGIKGYKFSKESSAPTEGNEWETESITENNIEEQIFTYEANENTTYYLHVIDGAGNISTSEGITISKVDHSDPEVKFAIGTNTPGSNDWYQTLNIQVTATDSQSGISSAKYCVGVEDCEPSIPADLSETETNKTFDVPFENNASPQKVCVSVTDGANNTKKICDTNTYKVDNSTPNLSLNKYYNIFGTHAYWVSGYQADAGVDGEWVSSNSDPVISFRDTSQYKNIKGVYVELEDPLNKAIDIQVYYTTIAGSYNDENHVTKNLAAGSKAISIDIPEGNYASIRVDIGTTIGLSYKIKYIALDTDDDIWNNSGMILEATMTDEYTNLSYCETSTDQTSYTKETGPYSNNKYFVAYTEDVNDTKYFQCYDEAGNKSNTVSKKVQIDQTPPVIEEGAITALLNGTTGIQVTVNTNNITETGSGISTQTNAYSFTLSDKTNQTSATNTATFTGLVQRQSYTVTVTVKDKAGNVSTEVVSNSVRIPGPTINLLGKAIEVVEEGNGLYEVDHSSDGTELGAEWKAKKEYRYAGLDPDNYVTFNGKTAGWRIIGLVNVKTSSGIEQRVKLIRASSIGNYSWDSSASGINSGYGVNEWSRADLKTLLNNYYYNSLDGQICYNSYKEASTSCSFGSTGLKDVAKSMIDESIVWNTGANGTSGYTSASNGLAKHFYQYERSSNTGKICTKGIECNDKVDRTTEWSKTSDTGYHGIGLIYPSDYGYATSGGDTETREQCLAKEIYSWDSDSWKTDCAENDWLKPTSGYYWTISPRSYSSEADNVFIVSSNGYVTKSVAYYPTTVLPVVYLSPSVVVDSGEGSEGSPFNLRVVN